VTYGGAVPWCSACEWGLDRYDPSTREPDFRWRWLDRLSFRLSFRLTAGQFAALAGRSVDRPRASASRVVTVAASLLLYAAILASAMAGVWLFLYRFPHPVTMLLGAALFGLAVALRPRFGRLDATAHPLERDQAPTLFGLVDRVAAAVGAPRPDVVAVDEQFNAFAAALGWRRRRVICLGLPMWAALTPQQRVALLGHELSHFVNGDVRRGLLTQPAFTALAVAADVTRPEDDDSPSPLVWFAHMIQSLISGTFSAAHLLLLAVALRDGQRAEYLADELAAKAAGTDAAAGLSDVSVCMETVAMVVRQSARSGGSAAEWQEAAQRTVTAAAPRMPVLRQRSVRAEASMFASHPPAGLRGSMLRARPRRAAAVVLAEAESERIDGELRREYGSVRRDIAA
jgi:Zn-dependent protease with chaperone function